MTNYYIAAVRELLTGAYTAETLNRFCQDRPLFAPVVAEFGPGHGLSDMVDRVISYCQTQLLWAELLVEVQRDKPRRYTMHGPYVGGGSQGAVAVPIATAEIRKQILQAIQKLQESQSQFVQDGEIAAHTGLEVQEIEDHLDLMEDDDLVSLAKSKRGSSAMLTARGRVALKDPEYLKGGTHVGDTYVFSGSFEGSFVNVNTQLDHASQSIGAIPTADEGTKQELEGLVEELKEALQQVPAEQEEEAEAVAEFANELVGMATEEKPNKVRLQITAEGLKAAAENLAAVTPTVLTIATQVAAAIMKAAGLGA